MNSIHLLLYSNAIAKCLVAVNISKRSLRRLSSLLSHWVGIVYLLLCYILVNWLLHHPVAVFVENLFWLIWKTCWWSFFFTQIWLLVLHNQLEIPFFFCKGKKWDYHIRKRLNKVSFSFTSPLSIFINANRLIRLDPLEHRFRFHNSLWISLHHIR